MNIKHIMWPALTALALVGCANAQPTNALVDARREYEAANSGAANSFVPDRVYEARVALEKAEQAHERDPGSEKEAHLAYVAHRKALIAQAVAQERMAKHELARAKSEYQQVLVTQRNTARSRLEEKTAKLSEATDDLEAAMKSLQELGAVKAEEQRITLTLSGEVLFKTDQSDLLPIARSRLERVAEVLKEQGVEKTMVVQGHTDSRGSDAYNDKLSQDRAESVRRFLIEEGLPAEKIRAVGKGEGNPIASNDSAEGRANNRRVEIVIDYDNGESGSGGMGPGGSMKDPGSTGSGSGTTPPSRGSTGTGSSPPTPPTQGHEGHGGMQQPD
jgi:outer membrane protein OmpA-like peptidoglycan-associated protein